MKSNLSLLIFLLFVNLTFAQNTPKLTIEQCNTPPKIDGIADNNDPWTDIWIPLALGYSGNTTKAMSAKFQLTYDSYNLYLIVQIEDSDIDTSSLAIPYAWENDNVELFIKMDISSGSEGHYTPGDYQFRQRRGSVFPDRFDISGSSQDISSKFLESTNFKIFQKDYLNKYIQEWQVPWALLATGMNTPWDGKYIKFDLKSTDNTTGIANGRTQMQFWNSNSDQQWNNTTYFGLIKLDEPIIKKVTNYYFSNTTGDDARLPLEANNPATPWKSLNKLNTFCDNLLPGDSVLFKRGDVFDGSIQVTNSGTSDLPIVFSAYGSGDKPVINGLTRLTNWSDSNSDGIWETNCLSCGTRVNIFLLNEQVQALGRYPNYNEPNKGYLTYESHFGNTQITDNQLSATPNWTGGEVVIRKNPFILDRQIIAQHSGNTITYNPELYCWSPPWFPENNFGYFIQNHINTLDQYGEWYYDNGAKKMYGYFGTINPVSLNAEAGVIDTLVYVNGKNNLIFYNLTFKGSNFCAFMINNAQNVSINNCDIQYSGFNGIDANNSNNIKIENNVVKNSNNVAMILNISASAIKNNIIRNTGLIPGMGKSGDGTYFGIDNSGNNNIIEYNEIDSTGYIPLHFFGDSILIKNNFINYFALTKTDAGGIYTCESYLDESKHSYRKIVGNIILNGVGKGEGTNSPGAPWTHGIYLDDNTRNVEIENNTTANCSSGLFIHNAHEITLDNNISYNNGTQLFMAHDNLFPNSPIRNTVVKNNILFSKSHTQTVLAVRTPHDDIDSFGISDSNYYCRPMDDNFDIYTNSSPSGINVEKLFDLRNWQLNYSKDLNSKTSPVKMPYYTLNNLVGLNKYENGNFDSNIDDIWCSGNCNASWVTGGKLDEGSLQCSYSPPSDPLGYLSLNLHIGSIYSEKNYILKFSMIGAKDDKPIVLLLRQGASSYSFLTPYLYGNVKTESTENEFLFVHPITENYADIQFHIDEQDSIVWLDNVQFYEADISYSNPDDYFRFVYNPTKTVISVSISEPCIDAKSNEYSGSMSLQPFSSVVLIKKDITQGVLKTLSVSPGYQNLSSSAGSETFTVNSNINWTVRDDSDWLTISPSSGSSDGTITANFSKNPSTISRTGIITVSGTGLSPQSISVEQEGIKILSVTPGNQNVSSAAGSTIFTVNSNTSWTVSNDSDWLTISPASGNNEGTITANFSENPSTSSRTGTITVTGTGLSTQTVNVEQEGIKILSVSPGNQNVSSVAGSTTFTINSNTSWTVSDNSDWLTINPASGNNNGTITANFSENTSTSSRIGNIAVSGTGLSAQIVTVEQEGIRILSVTPGSQNVSFAAGSTTFAINSNTSWTVSDNANWLTVKPTSGINDGTITVNFSKNPTTSSRTAEITISGSGLYSYVSVTQSKMTGITDYEQLSDVKVYPNPANDFINIDGLELNSSVTIYSLFGEKLTEVITNSNHLEISLLEFKSGIYFLKLTDNYGTHIKKLINN